MGAAAAARHRDRAEGARVVAPVLHLEEGPRALAGRVRRAEVRRFVDTRDGHLRLVAPREAVEDLEEAELLLCAEHRVDAGDGGDGLGAKLGIAPRHHDERLRVGAAGAADDLTALSLGLFRDGARVDDRHVGGRAEGRHLEVMRLEVAGHRARLRIVELAAEGVERYAGRVFGAGGVRVGSDHDGVLVRIAYCVFSGGQRWRHGI